MKKFNVIIATAMALVLTAAPSMAAGKGKPSPSASPSASASASTTGTTKRAEINVTGVVKAVAGTQITVTLKTVPQGKVKPAGLKKGADIVITLAATATVKRNGTAVTPAALTSLMTGDKVTAKIVSFTGSGTSAVYTAKSVSASGA